jgi:hypothetical protein
MEINDALDIAMETGEKGNDRAKKGPKARRVLSTRGLRDVAGEA